MNIFSAILHALGGGGGDAQKATAAQPEDTQPQHHSMLDSTESTAQKHMSIMDNVMFALLGPPDAILTPEAQAKKAASRTKASSMANSAANADFESYMGPPNAGGSSFGQTLGKVIGAVKGII